VSPRAPRHLMTASASWISGGNSRFKRSDRTCLLGYEQAVSPGAQSRQTTASAWSTHGEHFLLSVASIVVYCFAAAADDDDDALPAWS
jgi:hypothetical protein